MPNEKKNNFPREKKAAPPPARRKKTTAEEERSNTSSRERKPASPRPKREGDGERTAAPQRERRPASFSPRTKKTEEGERKTLPGRERKPGALSPRTKSAEGARSRSATAPADRQKRPGGERKGTAGKKTETTDDKNLVFPREARRYINVYLGLGSNVGNRRAQLQAAIHLISEHIGKIAKKSHLYETQPWGNPDQDAFLNQVIMINTMLDPRDLLKEVGLIEQELGRVRVEKEKWGPRIIDIDILFYGKRIVHDKGLEIPHPELHQRNFVLVPLMEIAPDLEHPVLKVAIDELYMESKDESEVIMLDS